MPSDYRFNSPALEERIKKLSVGDMQINEEVRKICNELFKDFNTDPMDDMLSKGIKGKDVIILFQGVCRGDTISTVKTLHTQNTATDALSKDPNSSFYKKP